MAIIGFMGMLKAQAEAIGDKRNAAHTRLQIQIVIAQLLETSGYDKLNIGAICKAVGLTRPGFYLHYANKDQAVLDLLTSLVDTERQICPVLTDCASVEQALGRICDWYIRFHKGSGALFATLTDMRRTSPEVYELWNRRSSTLHDMIVSQLNQFPEFRAIDPDWAVFTIEMTARAMNVTIDRLTSYPGPVSRKYAENIDDLIAKFQRMMYATLLAPPPADP